MAKPVEEVAKVGEKVSAGARIVRAILDLLGIAPKKGPKVEKLK